VSLVDDNEVEDMKKAVEFFLGNECTVTFKFNAKGRNFYMVQCDGYLY